MSNAFDFDTIHGEHLENLAGSCGVPGDLAKTANRYTAGNDRQLTADDIPSDLRKLAAKSDRLRDGLRAASPVPLALALKYCESQAALAGEGRAICAQKFEEAQRAIDAAVDDLARRITPTGKGIDPKTAAASVEHLLVEARGRAEAASAMPAWRALTAVLRDRAEEKLAKPRWLRERIGELSAKLAAAQ